ncbi:hypothetical protein GHT07_06585 [Caenimonas koreensis DSM 17982]|uniref:TonB family C-terminal domain-containing protein n=1 Tax=Caenimonas koreensis DSM 17982 TaxID=1121255 RepID=A0A844B6F2_9BURK|nr:hypothetical protein [Caenimonas koreensis]MRD46936.1 hypothetical protein [Caenimonas koreensis DSM 17982]
MKFVTGAFVLLGLALCATAANAQTGLVADVEPYAQCLTSTEGPGARPVYPEGLYARKEGGRVVVEMEFSAPGQAPRVKVLGDAADADFVDAVKRHAGQLRVPCMQPGVLVKLQQEFVFVPNDGRKVSWTTPEAGPSAGYRRECITRIDSASKPEMPRRAAREGHTGAVIARIAFDGLNTEPTVTLAYAGPHRELAETVVDYAKGYRLTCGGPKLSAMQSFVFRFSDSATTVLRDTTLVNFLRGVRNAAATPVFFDLNTMSCPFEVRLNYWQPASPNRVGEIGASVQARRPFLDWLATLRIKADTDIEAGVIGDSLTISVPCGKIDL